MTYRVHYGELAGPKYAGLDERYKIDKSNLYNNVYTFAVPAVHPDYTETSEAIGPPNMVRIRPDKTVTDPDGTIVASARVNTTYREAFHSFKYFESLGSVYGYHNIIMDRKEVNDKLYTRERWQGEPVTIERIDSINVDNPSQLDSTTSNCLLTLHAKINRAAQAGIDLEYDSLVNINGKQYLEIFIGEYHLLPNTPRSVYRTNISWDIHPVLDNKLHKNIYGESSCLEDGQTLSQLLTKNHITNVHTSGNTVLKKYPISQTASSFLEYYVGIAKVPTVSSRPKEMQANSLSMRHPNYLEAGAQIRWKSLKERCSSWTRIYDGSDLKELLSLDAYRPGHYVLNTKVLIDVEKLRIYLEHLNKDSETPIEWKILMWLPWFSMLAHDSIETITYPKLSTFIDSFDQVEFDMPANYKSGGSYHFSINIFDTDKTTLLYSESSDRTVPVYYNQDKFYSRIRAGRWYATDQQNEFKEIDGKPIRFNADYESGHGVNHENYGKIKYIPSNELSSYIATSQNLFMQIVTHDGTLKSSSEITMKYI